MKNIYIYYKIRRQFDSQEIRQLQNIIGGYKNIGAGKSEQILSNIFMILSKFMVSNVGLKDGMRTISKKLEQFFQVCFENSLNDCITYLLKNMSRNLTADAEENEEKLELAFSCVNFLKAATQTENIKRIFQTGQMGEVIQNVLKMEEIYQNPDDLPVEIEKIWTGRNNASLFTSLFGKSALFPYTRQSYRVLDRIANNFYLQYAEGRFTSIEESPPEDLSSFENLYNFEKIKESIFNEGIVKEK